MFYELYSSTTGRDRPIFGARVAITLVESVVHAQILLAANSAMTGRRAARKAKPKSVEMDPGKLRANSLLLFTRYFIFDGVEWVQGDGFLWGQPPVAGRFAPPRRSRCLSLAGDSFVAPPPSPLLLLFASTS